MRGRDGNWGCFDVVGRVNVCGEEAREVRAGQQGRGMVG